MLGGKGDTSTPSQVARVHGLRERDRERESMECNDYEPWQYR